MSPHLFIVVNDKGTNANTVRGIGRNCIAFYGNPIHKHQVVFLRVMKPESLLLINTQAVFVITYKSGLQKSDCSVVSIR